MTKKISKTTLIYKLDNLIKNEQGWKSKIRTYSPEKAVDLAIKYERQAESIGKKVGLPKEYILAILFREIACINITDNAADAGVINYFYYQAQREMYRNAKWYIKPFIVPKATLPMFEDCSTGIGQIFSKTAITSNNYAIKNNLLVGKKYKFSNWKHRKKVWYNLKEDNIYSVQMVGYVLRWGAYDIDLYSYDFKTISGAKKMFARYNGTNTNAANYGKIVYRYYELFKQYYK